MEMKMKLADLNLLDFGNTIMITGVVFSGKGQVLVCPFPGEHDPLDAIEHLDLSLDDWNRVLKQTDVLEVEMLAKAKDGTIAKAIVRKSQRCIEASVSWRVFKRDSYTCRYCGRDDAPLTVDHLVLWEEGGPSIDANLVSACKRCNKARGNTQYADWLVHPHYQRTSANLSDATRQANRALLDTLDKIPRNINQRTR
jgi:hypothetical protein